MRPVALAPAWSKTIGTGADGCNAAAAPADPFDRTAGGDADAFGGGHDNGVQPPHFDLVGSRAQPKARPLDGSPVPFRDDAMLVVS